MSRERAGKKTPDFGRRGSETIATAAVERKPTSMERLKTMGRRWLGKRGPQKTLRPGGRKDGRT